MVIYSLFEKITVYPVPTETQKAFLIRIGHGIKELTECEKDIRKTVANVEKSGTKTPRTTKTQYTPDFS